MLQDLIELCTTRDGQLLLVFSASDIATGLAYLSIPFSMVQVLHRRRVDIPHPELFALFIVFVAACGTTHLTHAYTALVSPITEWEAISRAVTAAVSAPTVVVFWFLLPRMLALPSPAAVRADLESRVRARTAELEAALMEKRALYLELNHRVGNILANTAAARQLLDRYPERRIELLQLALDRTEAVATEYHALAEGRSAETQDAA